MSPFWSRRQPPLPPPAVGDAPAAEQQPLTGQDTPTPPWTVAGRWVEDQIDGHLCYVYEPPSVTENFTVLYLHGVHLGRLQDHPVFAAHFDRYQLRVVAPVTQRSWWTDRICGEFDQRYSAEQFLMRMVLPWMETRYDVRPPRLALLGTSMGGQGALRLSYKYPHLFPVVAAISPAIDYHQWWRQGDPILQEMYESSESARQDTVLLHIHPLNWPRNQFFCCDPTDDEWYDGNDRLRMKLASLGVPFDCDLETIAGGHGYQYYERMAPTAIEYISQRLQRERQRV